MKNIFLFLLLTQTAYAKEAIKVGTFSLFTEAGWGAAFELKNDGTADVVPAFDAENEDGSSNPRPKTKHIKATWKEVKGGIELSYLKHRDQFRLVLGCGGGVPPGYACFRYVKSIEGPESESLLKFEQPFVNWKWKTSEKYSPSGASQECIKECKEMSRSGTLKKGMSIDQCVQSICN